MSLFKKPNELLAQPTLKVAIYGQPGSGKTTIGLSSPKPVMFDFDGGINRTNKAFQCPTLEVSKWEDVKQALDELKCGEIEFQSIIVDTCGKMLDFMSDYIIRNNSKMAKYDGSLTLQGYGARKVMFINFLRECTMMGKNVVFICHEKEEKDGETRIVRPDMSGSSLGDLLKELDLVGYVQMLGTERTVSWTPQEKFYAKNCCNLPAVMKIPCIIDAQGGIIGENDFLAKTFNAYAEYLKAQAKISERYSSLVDQITEDVAEVNDGESANAFIKKMCEYTHIWDSKARARRLLAERVDALGLKYNKAKKLYEDAAKN